jgi:Calpain family cysteine protease
MKSGKLKILAAVAITLLGISQVISASPSTQPATQPAEKHTPFVTVLLRNWDKWDTNKDGELSALEIDRAVLDPTIKGEDAAVAGTLKLLSRNKKNPPPPLTRYFFDQYDLLALPSFSKPTPTAAETATADTVASQSPPPPTATSKKLPVNWDLYFVAGQKRMARGGKIIWPDKLNLDNMRQGPLGDCYFISVIGSMVVHRPELVQQLIQPTDDGKFQVTFPNVQPFILHTLTDSELAISSTTSTDGVWLAAMEQAFGQYRERVKGMTLEEGTDTIYEGGFCGPTMAILTGHQFRQISLARTIESRQARSSQLLPLIRKEMIAAMGDHRLMTASVNPAPVMPSTLPTTRPVFTGTIPVLPPDINKKHAYTVVNYDPQKDTVEIWNPHGQSFTPKGDPGLLNGYPTVHGRFTLPLKEAYLFFTSFTFEMPTAATQSTAAIAVPRP